MTDIQGDLKSYLEAKFKSDSEIADDVNAYEEYEYDHTPEGNEIYVYPLNDVPSKRSWGGNAFTRYVPMEIAFLCRSQTIGGVEYSAQKACKAYMEKAMDMLEPSEVFKSLDYLIDINRSTTTLAIPYEQGSKYYVGVLRYEVYIKA